jgi:uncharacterized membrane protein YkoI
MRHAICWLMVGMLGLGMLAVSAGPAAAGEKAGKEEKVSLNEVPEAARNTILHEAAGHKVREIEKETGNGRTVYEAEWKVDGKEVEVKVAADGKLLEREMEVALKDVPAAARETILKEAAGSKVAEVEKVVAGDRVTYEAEWKADGKEIEITVSPAGKVLGREVEDEDDDEDDDDDKSAREEKHEDGEVDVTLDQVPDAVRATILKEAAGHKIEEIERETRGGRTVYEAEWEVDGKEIEIKVAPDGTLLSKDVEGDDDDDEDDNDDDDDDDDDN